jgi:hypothetical protein
MTLTQATDLGQTIVLILLLAIYITHIRGHHG